MAVEEEEDGIHCSSSKGRPYNRKKRKLKKKRVKRLKMLKPSISEGISPLVSKYWHQRYNLFSRYDEGIKMDEEGWFSVTPEDVAIRHAERSGGGTIIDGFAGVGGNAIQFARILMDGYSLFHVFEVAQKQKPCLGLLGEKEQMDGCHLKILLIQRSYHVVAIDVDPQKVLMAFNNAKIYGVKDYIDFIVGDFFQLAPHLKGDVVFLSPPWGGPSYCKMENFTLDFLKPKDGYSLLQVAQRITPNIIMFLPRNVDLNQVEELSWLSSPPLHFEVEENYVDGYLKGITAYFGDTAQRSHALF